MIEQEFRNTLARAVECSACRHEMEGLEWAVSRRVHGDWMGICICKCPVCSLVMVAAAGSSPEAHTEAQETRAKLLHMAGI